MAVAYDNDTQALNNTNVSSVTYSHTTAGSNRALAVFVALHGTGQTVSSITYAGTALTVIGTITGATNQRLEAWGLAAAATGANNVVVTLSASNDGWDASAISFTGANQTFGTCFTGVQSANNGTGTSITNTVTTGQTNDVVVSGTCSSSGDGTAPGSGQTQQWLDNSGASNTMGSTKAGAASVAMVENWINSPGTDGCSAIAVNIAQVSGGVVVTPHRGLMGAGV